MLKSEIRIGGIYRAKVSGRIVDVRVTAIDTLIGNRERAVYHVVNLSTGRQAIFQSAAKFRSVSHHGTPG